MRPIQRRDKATLYRVKFQAELWPAVAEAQGWNPRDEVRRRDLRARCWEEIGLENKGDGMPLTDAEFTALKTFCLHLSDELNITRSIAWTNCCRDFRKFNEARISDYHQRLASVPEYRGRTTAAGQPLDDPLSRKESTHRLIRMRASARKHSLDPDKKFQGRDRSPQRSADPDLCPF